VCGVTVALWAAITLTAGRTATSAVNAENEGHDPGDGLVLAAEPAEDVPPVVPVEPAEPPRVEPTPTRPQTVFPRYRRSRFRLASVPNMFGDTLPPGGQVQITAGTLFSAVADVPLAGGARRIRVAENNKALPMDRVYFTYNHFENARDLVFDDNLLPPLQTVRSSPIDRYVIGIEKTFFDEVWSVDVRMPFVNRFSHTEALFNVSGGEIGNLHVNVKRLLHVTDWSAFVGGLGIDVPTGSDVKGTILGGTQAFEVNNDAVHLAPFVGFLHAPDDRWFYHGFLEVDVPLNGHAVSAGGASGRLNEQTLLNLDLSAGRWLCRRPDAFLLTGAAATVEFHYTTTLTDGDMATLLAPDRYDFNLGNRMDVVNLTVGVHAELAAKTTLHVGGAFPLTDRMNRLFDAEVQVQLNRYF